MSLINGTDKEDAPKDSADFRSTGFDIDASASVASMQVVVEVIDTNSNEAANGSADCVLFVRDQITKKWTATSAAVTARNGEVTYLPLSPSPIPRKGIVVTSNVRGVRAAQRRVTVLGPSVLPARAASPSVAYVRFWGDSITEGVANPVGEPSAYRGEFQRLARIGGDDVRPLGTRYAYGVANATGVGVRRHAPGLPRHEGVAGNTIAQVTARVAAAVATEQARVGLADVEFVMAGTNDVSGGNSAAMLTAMGTLIDTLRAANPTGYIVVCSIPRNTPYASTRAAYNSGLSALVASKDSRVLYLDTCSDFTRADMGTVAGPTEDTHPSRRGLMKIARRMYDRFRLLFPLRSGPTSPRGYAARLTQASLSLTAGTNGFQRTGGAFESAMGTASWLAAISVFYPSSLPAGSAGLIGFGSPYNAGGFAIAANASGGASLYGTGSASPLIAGYFTAKADTWHRYWASWNATSKILSFWGTPNSVPVLFNAGVVDQSWSSAYPYLIIGAGDIAAPTCYLEHAEFCVGSSVPSFDDLYQHIERNWYEGVQLPGCAAHFPMDEGTGVAIADANGGSAPVKVGSVAWATQAHDWDG